MICVTGVRTAEMIERVQMEDAQLRVIAEADEIDSANLLDDVEYVTSDGETILAYVSNLYPRDGRIGIMFS